MPTLRLAHAAVLAVLLATGAAGASAPEELGSPARKMPTLSVDPSPVARAGVLTTYADVLEPMQQSVVTIESRKNPAPAMPSMRPGRGGAPAPFGENPEVSLGSGVIVSTDGYILTNNHVVADADQLNVVMANRRRLPAKLIGSDPKTDIAVIKIEGDTFPAVTLADSDKLRVGDIVFAIGNPLDVGQSVTMGIVSAKGRNVEILKEVEGYEDFIQTDAAINLGNSGGALVDAKGRLIGINSAILSTSRGIGGNIGIGFAVPVNLASRIMESLVTTGAVARGWLGLFVDEFEPEVAETLGLKKDTRGVVVNGTEPGAPAAKAGLKKDDVITAIDGIAISSRNELRLIIAQKAPGTKAKLEYFRGGQAESVEVTLGQTTEGAGDPSEVLKGVKVAVIDADLRRSKEMASSWEGLLVTSIDPASPHRNKLEVGMVILEINSARPTELAATKALFGKPGRYRVLVGSPNRTPLLIVIDTSEAP